MDLDEAAGWIDLIVRSAPRLRAVRVTSLAFGEIEIDLAPPDVVFEPDSDEEDGKQRHGGAGVDDVPLPLPTFERRKAK